MIRSASGFKWFKKEGGSTVLADPAKIYHWPGISKQKGGVQLLFDEGKQKIPAIAPNCHLVQYQSPTKSHSFQIQMFSKKSSSIQPLLHQSAQFLQIDLGSCLLLFKGNLQWLKGVFYFLQGQEVPRIYLCQALESMLTLWFINGLYLCSLKSCHSVEQRLFISL